MDGWCDCGWLLGDMPKLMHEGPRNRNCAGIGLWPNDGDALLFFQVPNYAAEEESGARCRVQDWGNPS
jgi:hypothetical protein